MLFGQLEVVSYDWVGKRPRGQGASAEAVMHSHGPASAGSLLSLFPDSGGNVHSFYASKPSAILDILIPGYVGGVCSAEACLLVSSYIGALLLPYQQAPVKFDRKQSHLTRRSRGHSYLT
jgi:hypothetical protein